MGSDFAAPALENITGWPYRDVNVARHPLAPGTVPGISSWPFVDWVGMTGRVYYGDDDGHFYVVKPDGTLYGTFPIQPVSAGYSHPDVYGGVITVGTTDGQILYIDESTATVFRRIAFGSGRGITDINYDWASDKYVVGTTTGELYYVPWMADPTP